MISISLVYHKPIHQKWINENLVDWRVWYKQDDKKTFLLHAVQGPNHSVVVFRLTTQRQLHNSQFIISADRLTDLK